MAFTLHSELGPLTWDDGFAGGDSVVRTVAAYVDSGELVAVTPTGPFVEPGEGDEATAWWTAWAALTWAHVAVTGWIAPPDGPPEAPGEAVPADAVA